MGDAFRRRSESVRSLRVFCRAGVPLDGADCVKTCTVARQTAATNPSTHEPACSQATLDAMDESGPDVARGQSRRFKRPRFQSLKSVLVAPTLTLDKGHFLDFSIEQRPERPLESLHV